MTELRDGGTYIGEVRAYVFDGDLAPDVVVDPDRLGALLDQSTPTAVETNLVTNVGRAQMTKLIVGEAGPVVGYIGLTTSLTTPALTATALTNEIFRKAVSQRVSYLTYYQRYMAYYATTDFASTGLAGEGLFDTASTGGAMWAVTSITVSKSAAQSLVVVHLIQATT